MLPPLPPHNIILFELNLNVKFPLLPLLQFLSDSKSTSYNTKLCYMFDSIIMKKVKHNSKIPMIKYFFSTAIQHDNSKLQFGFYGTSTEIFHIYFV